MNRLRSWIQSEGSKSGERPFLEEVILTHDLRPYAFHRLNQFALRTLLFLAINAVEFAFISFSLPTYGLYALILLKNLLLFSGSFWWGFLEGFRTRLRFLEERRDRQQMAELIHAWASRTFKFVLGIFLVLLLGLGFLVFFRGWYFTVYELFVLGFAFRFAFDSTLRVYASGIYAIRRIYRPLPIIALVEVLSFVLTFILWRWLSNPAWAFPVMYCLSSVVSGIVSAIFVSMAYQKSKIPPLPKIWKASRLSAFSGVSLRESLFGGWSYAFVRLESVFVVLLMLRFSQDLEFVAFMHLISPLIGAGAEWAQTFYFDLKRLDQSILWSFKKAFHQMVHRISFFVAGSLWVVSVLIGLFYLEKSYWVIFPLALFFLARALLASVQLRLFAEGAFTRLFLCAIGVCIAMVLLTQLPVDRGWILGTVSLAFLMASWITRVPHGTLTEWHWETRNFFLLNWIARVATLSEPVQIRSVRFWFRGTGTRAREIAARMEDALGLTGRIALVNAQRVVWYETKTFMDRSRLDSLILQWSGRIESFEESGVERDGLRALMAADKLGIFSVSVFDSSANVHEAVNPDLILKRFKREFPDGSVIEIGGKPLSRAKEWTRSQRRRLIEGAIRFAHGQRIKSKDPNFDVASTCHQGDLKYIFLIPRSYDESVRLDWQRHVRQLNLIAAALPHLVTINKIPNSY